jgi:selenide,water dikinase
MGARPLTALNVVAWPVEQLGTDPLKDVLRGGEHVARAAGVAIIGGHTIDDPEPKYGLAVSGTVDPRKILSNTGGHVGDALVLTKPVGVGAICTALKGGFASPASVAEAAARSAGAHAVTDVTGFGLLGHLHQLAGASGVAAEVDAAAVPAIASALELLADDRALAGGSRRNREDAESYATFADGVDEPHRRLVCDAMTSGGLLIALEPERAAELPGVAIGRLVEGPPGTIRIT